MPSHPTLMHGILGDTPRHLDAQPPRAASMRQPPRSISALPVVALVWSCASAPPAVVPDPMDAVREQLAQAHDLSLRGCYRCLIEARDLYDDLARQGFDTDEGAAGLLRTTLLIGMREREMGLPGGGGFERAAALAGLDVAAAGEAAAAREAAEAEGGAEAGETRETPAGESRETTREADEAAAGTSAGETAATGGAALAGPEWETFLRIAATTPWQDVGVSKDLSEENVYARAIADRDRDAWNRMLQPLVPADPLAAYLYLSLNCTSAWLAEQPPELAEVLAAHDDAVYVRYRQALCAGEQVALASVQAIEPRFTEMEFFLGQHALPPDRGPNQGDAALAEFHYLRAHEEWPEWAARPSPSARSPGRSRTTRPACPSMTPPSPWRRSNATRCSARPGR